MYLLKTVIASTLFMIALPAAAQEKPELDRNHPDAVRCKRFPVIGSLVKKERICKTNAEWRASAEQQNRDADDMITRSRAGMNPNG